MTHLTEEQAAELIGLLRPVPAPWLEAAIELPRARAAIDELVAQAIADAARRQAIVADFEAALRGAGLEPTRGLVEDLRVRLGPCER